MLDQSQPRARRLRGHDLHQGADAAHNEVLAHLPIGLREILILIGAHLLKVGPEGVRMTDVRHLAADVGDGDGEVSVAFALGPASVAHGEGQTVQVGPVAEQSFQETVGLLLVEVIDLRDLVRRVLHRLGVLRHRDPELDFRHAGQVIAEERTGVLDLRGARQQILQRRLRVDRELEARRSGSGNRRDEGRIGHHGGWLGSPRTGTDLWCEDYRRRRRRPFHFDGIRRRKRWNRLRGRLWFKNRNHLHDRRRRRTARSRLENRRRRCGRGYRRWSLGRFAFHFVTLKVRRGPCQAHENEEDCQTRYPEDGSLCAAEHDLSLL